MTNGEVWKDTTGIIYEVIKKEDLVSAFREALASALIEVLGRIDYFVQIYTSIETRALWVFDLRNRLDYDYLM
jgi:hypothetical protein